MNPPQPEPGLPHHHHHLVHLHLNPSHHHHHVHIHLCHHLHRHAHPVPVSTIPDARPGAVPWKQPEPPFCAVGEGEAEDPLDAEQALYAEEGAEEEDEEPVFVLTDEWAEFFAKSDAKRRLAKQQKKNKGRK